MKLFSEFIDGMFFNLDQRSYWQAEHYGFNYQRFTAKLADNNTISGQVIIPNTAKPIFFSFTVRSLTINSACR